MRNDKRGSFSTKKGKKNKRSDSLHFKSMRLWEALHWNTVCFVHCVMIFKINFEAFPADNRKKFPF